MASTARHAASQMLTRLGDGSSSSIVCSGSRVTLSALDAMAPRVMAPASARPGADTRKRPATLRFFSTNCPVQSAWPLGKDASPETSANDPTLRQFDKAKPVFFPPGEQAVTVRDINEKYVRGEKLAMLTAYNYPSALALRSAPMDLCLVGDSLTNVSLGHRTTHPLTLEQMIQHVQAVARGLRHPMLNQSGLAPIPLLVADIPMGYAEISLEEGVRTAVALIKQGGADAVKIEGGLELQPLIARLSAFGIPVIAHIGLQPQRVSSGSALNLAGSTAHDAQNLLGTALELQEAGAFACLIECVPAVVAKNITSRLSIPVIGIGAGPSTGGQVLVQDDILGECTSPLYVLAGVEQVQQDGTASHSLPLTQQASFPRPASNTPSLPRFVRSFISQQTGGTTFGALRMAAVQAYVAAVKGGTFPTDAESYKMKKEEYAQFKAYLDLYDRELKAAIAAHEDGQSPEV